MTGETHAAAAPERPLPEVVERTFAALRGAGLTVDEAFDTTRALLYGELRGGKARHGLDRVPWVRANLGRSFHPGRPLEIGGARGAADVIVLEGNDGLGYSQVYLAALVAQRLAARRSTVSVAVRRSYPTNCLGDPASILARAGLCSHVGTISPGRVAFPGGRRPLLPTSGQAFGFPGDPPVVLDFHIGAASNGDLAYARTHGRPLPGGAFVDRHGKPGAWPDDVSTPTGELTGAILPRGGPGAAHVMAGLGVGLVLACLSVGIPPGTHGSFLLVRRPVPGMAEAAAAWIEALARDDPAALVPGHRSFELQRRALARGRVPVPDEIWRPIVEGAEAAGRGAFADIAPDTVVAAITRQLGESSYAPISAGALERVARIVEGIEGGTP